MTANDDSYTFTGVKVDSVELVKKLSSISKQELMQEISNALSRGIDDDEVANWITLRIDCTRSRILKATITEIEKHFEELLNDTNNGMTYVSNEVATFWGYRLDQVAFLIRNYYELGACCNKYLQNLEIEADACWVFAHLHALGCRCANEVVALQKAGYNDRAITHARTMYEYQVVSKAIMLSEDPESTARKYRLHAKCELKKQYEILEHKNALTLFELEELERLKVEVENLVEKYGRSYSKPWGWANHIVSNPSFTSLDKAVAESEGAELYHHLSSRLHASALGFEGAYGFTMNGVSLVSGPVDLLSPLPSEVCLMSLKHICSGLIAVIPDDDDDDEMVHGLHLWKNGLTKISETAIDGFREQSDAFLGAAGELMAHLENKNVRQI